MAEKLHISLIDTGSPRNEINEPIGIETVAGPVSSNENVDIQLHSMQLEETNDIPSELLQGKNIIGISTKLGSLEQTERVLEKIKYLNTGGAKPLVLLGDLFATFAFRELLSIYPDLICVRGEGEDAFRGIAEVMLGVRTRSKKALKSIFLENDIPNLAFVQNGEMVETIRKTVHLDTAAMPSRALLAKTIQKQGIVRAESSRGCAWGRCQYCCVTSKYGERGWRAYPIQKVVDELKMLSNAGVKNPQYTDEDFIGNDPERAMNIAREIIAAKKRKEINPALSFYINMRVSSVVGEDIKGEKKAIELLSLLKKAGLREVFIGVESGSLSQMKRYGKDATIEKNIKAIQILNSLGIDADIGFIMFDPQMKAEEILENIEFLERAGIADHDARFIKKFRAQPFAGITNNLQKEGMVNSTLDINSLTYPYSFQDPKVQKIYEAFQEWEEGAIDFIHHLQALSRGEMPSKEYRKKCKFLLGKLRKLDLLFLKALTKDILSDTIVKELQKTRNYIINTAKGDIPQLEN